MKISNLFKQPWYFFRPKQIFLSCWRRFFCSAQKIKKTCLPWKLWLAINIKETIGKNIWLTGCHELEVSEVLWRLIVPKDYVIDIGANIGYTVSIMALKVGKLGVVKAFEPNIALHDLLNFNVKSFSQHENVGRILVYDFAISDHNGVAVLIPFHEGNWGTARISNCDDQNGIEVQVRKLDEIDHPKVISVLKIDAEGHELKILEGAENLLLYKQIENIVYEGHPPAADIHNYLKKFGYSIYHISWNASGVQLMPIEAHKPLEIKIGHAPNYLATLFPEKIIEKFKRSGWRCLNGPAKLYTTEERRA